MTTRRDLGQKGTSMQDSGFQAKSTYRHRSSIKRRDLENPLITSRWLKGIHENGDFLVLGTSETARGLYWEMLSEGETSSIPGRAVVLSGAGRSSDIWITFFLANREAVQDLRVIYYVNPTYWRSSLNRFSAPYYRQYISPRLFEQAKDKIAKGNLLRFVDADYFGEENHPRENALKTWVEFIRWKISAYRRGIGQGAPVYEKPDAFYERAAQDQQGEIDHSTNTFGGKEKPLVSPPTDSTYQTEALGHFIQVAREVRLKLHIVLGPYNGVLARQASPSVIPRYEKLHEQIVDRLNELNVSYTDTWDLSYTKGTFIDPQHISRLGGFLTAQKVKETYRGNIT